MAKLGRWNLLEVLEQTENGLLLDGGREGEILMPNRYVPEDADTGSLVDVFVYLDSKDRLIATTETPILQVGEFGTLKVVEMHPRAGAFLDWGLAKDLLLPYVEQLGRVRVGQSVLVGVQVDKKSARIVATMRTNRLLTETYPSYRKWTKVKLIISECTPMGYNAIVNQRHVGLIYHQDIARKLQLGEEMEGYVRQVRDDGKIDLSLQPAGYARVASSRNVVLDKLKEHDGFMDVGDKTNPDRIRDLFGLSKKAFKQSIGTLYKKRLIEIREDGIRLIEDSDED